MAVSKSKTAKPSKVVKPKKNTKRTTETTKNHRFQGFTERIAKLKIDPIRRQRNLQETEELSEDTDTYFGRSLTEWRDLNLSQTFTSFAKEAAPLCDNLPMLLHNEEKIMDVLVEYIAKGDQFAMEPLLGLLAHFAHDLDARFEKHFARAVSAVAAVASRHPDPAVIEWSFTCLAWLFKYLQRLLVPDLRPLYDLMSPYLGKESQKAFIIRFAAESLSFLVRKAAVVYEKDQKPLDTIIAHVLEDASATEMARSADLHRQGVMVLLTEAIKGVQQGMHSGALAIMRSLLRHIRKDPKRSSIDILVGTLTSLIHFANSETFQPITDTCVDELAHIQDKMDDQQTAFTSEVLFTIVSVRKGTRVQEWKGLVSVVSSLVKSEQVKTRTNAETKASILSLLAIVLQTAPVNGMLPALGLLDLVREDVWTPHFIRFCDYFARLGRERFEQFLLPHLQKYILAHWDDSPEKLLAFLPRVGVVASGKRLQAPEAMQKYLSKAVEEAAFGESGKCVVADVALRVSDHVQLQDCYAKALQEQLAKTVELGLRAQHDDFSRFALGSALCRAAKVPGSIMKHWPALCSAGPQYAGLPSYWSGMVALLKSEVSLDVTGSHIEPLREALVSGLASPSHLIRTDCLDIIDGLYKRGGQQIPELLSIAVLIESTPINLDTSRSISMNIRRLAAAYKHVGDDVLMQKAMPTFCFGLLHLRLSQAWNDATDALSSMSQSSLGEETIVALAQAWLEQTPDTANLAHSQPAIWDVDSEISHVASDFECSNLAKVSAMAKQVFGEPYGGHPSPSEAFEIEHRNVNNITDSTRTQALRVLDKMPQVAEKRSRLLVPVLLRWAGPSSEQGDSLDAGRWSRKDQKAMLAVFAKFFNPRVLYRSPEVHNALLNLCANGDVEIQRSALKAVLAWREPALQRCEEHLVNFLDDARFREEMSVFLQGDGDESLSAADRPAVMPVLLRLLYGRAVGGSKDNQHARRKAIFVALSRFEAEVLGSFIDIALDKADSLGMSGTESTAAMPLRQQLGLLNMVNDMLETLGAGLEPYAVKLADAALTCSVAAAKRLDNKQEGELQDASLLRSIRQTGLQCLVKIFADMQELDLALQGKLLVTELISPRLQDFANENTQGLSAAMRLFAAWSNSSIHAQHLFAHDDTLMTRMAELLGKSGARNEVKTFILRDILDALVSNDEVKDQLQPHVSAFVTSIAQILSQQPAGDVLSACVKSTSKLAERITDPKQAEEIVNVCAHLLRQPSNFVHPSVKTGLVRTMMPLLDVLGTISPPESVYEAISGLFSRLRDLESRVLFSEALMKLSKNDLDLQTSTLICQDINALESGRLNEPDHTRRERGFARIYEQSDKFTVKQWMPILHNCLYFIRDEDDTVNRSSASRALELFIVASSKNGRLDLLKSDLFPAIQRGMKEPSELVRAEYLRLLGVMVQNFPDWNEMNDMTSLTVEGDDEASFFTNALHIQQHRRLRALRRLAEEPKLRSQNVSRIFIPLMEQFIFDAAEGDAGRTLADQAVQTIGALAKNLKWSDFRTVIKRYFGQLKKAEEQEKVILRLIGAMVDGLCTKMSQQQEQLEVSGEPDTSRTGRQRVIMEEFLPPLSAYLHQKDESTVDRRVAVAVSIVKLLRLLPEHDFVARLAPTLTDISHILKSRDMEAREQTRRTFSIILTLVGPTYLSFMLKELRSALQKGYQLHVLSYTVHYLLVTNAGVFEPGSLDDCLPELTAIIMDDIFGVTGQEKDAEEYKSGMKEVKSSKSYDTMEIISRLTSIPKLGQVILPIRAMLQEKLDSQTVRKIDDLLVRVRKGVDQNPAADSRDMLVFCHEIVRQVYAREAQPAVQHAIEDYKVRKYLIAADRKADRKGATTSYLFKLSSFALNLVRKVVRRHDDLQTAANMAGYLPVIGDAIVGGQEEVQLAAVKLLSTIIRVPLPDIDANAPVYFKEAVGIIKASVSTTSDSAKAALDLITAILREKRSVTVKENDIAYLLKTLKQDLDEPDRQGILFRFLRAVIGRKIVITEVYEVMDEVAQMMITNPDESVRQSARGAYVQFVMDYPQGKDRWAKQTGFLIKNLEYPHVAGRRSVMEVIHSLLGKLVEDTVQPLLMTLLVGLVPRLTSDNDKACRDMASLLISKVYERADAARETIMTDTLTKWMAAGKKQAIRAAALQCWTIYVKLGRTKEKQLDTLLKELDGLLEVESDIEVTGDRQFVLAALQLLTAIFESSPERATAKRRNELWTKVQHKITLPAVDVQEAAARLQSMLFNDMASTVTKANGALKAKVFFASGDLRLDVEGLRSACATNLRVLRNTSADGAELVQHLIRNLVFLGRAFSANDMQWAPKKEDVEEEDEVEGEEHISDVVRDTSAIGYLLSRLSAIIRRENTQPFVRYSALQAQMSLLAQLTAPFPHTTTIIRPLYSLTDPSIPQPPGELHANLSNLAREALDMLQRKLGSEAFVAEMAMARKVANERRDERRQKRRIDAVSAPEKWAKEKRKKYEGKKLKQKEKGYEARGKRRGW